MDIRNGQTGANKQQRSAAPQSGVPAREPQKVRRPEGGRKRMWITIVILAAVAIIVAAAIVMWFSRPAGGDLAIQRDKYQAVFLTNGQVYFGKLAGASSESMQLTDVYYLQVQQDVQGETGAEQAQASAEATKDESQVSLAKLGNELHGPEDAMQINREQVLFWENLTDDSKVVSAIKQHTGQ
jgi:flagellar basal body-associated protein FliL